MNDVTQQAFPTFNIRFTGRHTADKMVRIRKLSTEESEKLIELVRINPAIYNATLADHKDSHMLNNIWISIAKSMGTDTSKCIQYTSYNLCACLFYFNKYLLP